MRVSPEQEIAVSMLPPSAERAHDNS